MSTIPPRHLPLRDGRTVTLRHADPADAAAVVTYVRTVLSESPHFLLSPGEFAFTPEQEAEFLQGRLDDPNSLAVVAEHAGEIIGVLTVDHSPRSRIAHTISFGISLRSAWRGHGIGSAMLQTLLDWATATPSIEKVGLSCFAGNARALALYRRFGFQDEGRRPRAFKLAPGCYDDELLLYRFVRPGASGAPHA